MIDSLRLERLLGSNTGSISGSCSAGSSAGAAVTSAAAGRGRRDRRGRHWRDRRAPPPQARDEHAGRDTHEQCGQRAEHSEAAAGHPCRCVPARDWPGTAVRVAAGIAGSTAPAGQAPLAGLAAAGSAAAGTPGSASGSDAAGGAASSSPSSTRRAACKAASSSSLMFPWRCRISMISSASTSLLSRSAASWRANRPLHAGFPRRYRSPRGSVACRRAPRHPARPVRAAPRQRPVWATGRRPRRSAGAPTGWGAGAAAAWLR